MVNITFLPEIRIVGQKYFIHCSRIAYVDVNILSKNHPERHLDANGIKPGSNSKMNDKHTAEHSNTACLGGDRPVCDV